MKTKQLTLPQQRLILLAMFLVLAAAFLFSICIGRYSVTPFEAVNIICGYFFGDPDTLDPVKLSVVIKIRLPRILLAILIGGGLAAAGGSYQAIFGNPLVSPDILGVSSGAGFGAALGILLSAGMVMVEAMSLVFGLAAVALVLLISRVQKKTELFMLVLSGVIIGALFEAFVSLIKYIADPQDKLPAIVIWLMGSLASASYNDVLIAALVILPCLVILLALRWKMNLLSLDEEEARSLGVNVGRLRLAVILVSTLMTAVSVSLCGIIGWIGLVIPHVGRLFIGNDHRALMPACAFLGGTYLLLIDGLARTMTAAEIPLSILTAIIGAPFFAYMLRKTTGG
ncbi:MAG: iron ABC transporter permease [Peptococcaceae bacterium]|nr:iron ABC transporter permease [Peptococcaceae bacterium]